VFQKIPLLCAFILILPSCSSLLSRRTPVGSEAEPKEMSMVPKVQYDELLRRYEDLQRRYNDQVSAQLNPQEERIITDIPPVLDYATNDTMTVDAFAQEKKKTAVMNIPSKKKAPPVNEVNVADLANSLPEGVVEKEIIALQRAQSLIVEKQYAEAMRIFKELENSSIFQIRVRAKFYTGELLLQQANHDLALQVFEEVIEQFANSSIVLKALEKAIYCAEILKLQDKVRKYRSMLNDIFGIK